jgi:purine-binding chemotaxis protein CheW
MKKAAQQAPEKTASRYLTFMMKEEIYGLEIERVKEILEFRGVTRMPMTPDFIRGVINLRGNVVAVMDLQQFFFSRETEITRYTCIVIVERETDGEMQYTGILVDSVRQVLDLGEDDLDETPEFGTPVANSFVSALGKTDEGLVVLLSLDALLTFRTVVEARSEAISKIEEN